MLKNSIIRFSYVVTLKKLKMQRNDTDKLYHTAPPKKTVIQHFFKKWKDTHQVFQGVATKPPGEQVREAIVAAQMSHQSLHSCNILHPAVDKLEFSVQHPSIGAQDLPGRQPLCTFIQELEKGGGRVEGSSVL